MYVLIKVIHDFSLPTGTTPAAIVVNTKNFNVTKICHILYQIFQ